MVNRLKNVQISEELFFALLKYHLVEMDEVLPQIKKGLEEFPAKTDLPVPGSPYKTILIFLAINFNLLFHLIFFYF